MILASRADHLVTLTYRANVIDADKACAATAKLKVVVPFTLLIIFVLLYVIFRRFDEALLIMIVVPFALIGGFWLLLAGP